MMDKAHILIVSQYFYPEQFRINDICSELVKRGHHVTVLTGIPNYPQGKFYDGYGFFRKTREKYNGADVIRLPLLPRGSGSIMMALNYLSFVVSGFFWSLFTSLDADYVFIYEVSPMTQALPGVWYAKRKKIPSIIYVTDLWPENVEIVGGVHNRYILHMLGKMVDYIYARCNKIFVSSNSFVDAINGRGVPLQKLKFWPQYAEEFYRPLPRENVDIPEIPADGTFNIIFAGNIGLAQGLDILPKTAKILKDRSIDVRFNIVGDGRFKEALIKMVDEDSVSEYFNFVEKQPAERIPEFMSVCDATLISLSSNEIFKMTLPAKLPSCFACGMPVLVCADGEIQDVVRDADAGFSCNAGDHWGFADIIEKVSGLPCMELHVIGQNARRYFEDHFEKHKLLDDLESEFVKVGNRNV
ncbi:glycosyltransferase family 4 protein [Synergistaceae bacterium OttesenSCG-928-D05]|nr:glycosyltransferase family 4 protein [Synergistaceae bacterium OttesenSCG-928-D05]